MESVILIVILIEYVLLVTTTAPMFLVARFSRLPDLGVVIWFALFLSVVLAGLLAVALAIWSVFQGYLSLQDGEPLGSVLLTGFAPWALIGFAGILLALTNQKLEPLFVHGKKADYLALVVPREIFKYRRARVFELDLPGYYGFTKDLGIYLTKAAFELPHEQLQAVLRHEYGHIKLGHNNLKKVTALAVSVMPWFAVSRAFSKEIDRLCELSADGYALRRVYSKDLYEARRLFI